MSVTDLDDFLVALVVPLARDELHWPAPKDGYCTLSREPGRESEQRRRTTRPPAAAA